jgi:prepilin-type N-terminal cleavage/methylation domain-containing protein
MRYRKAFTLVELLVVIGIITILAGLLLPAVNHMRRVAQITGQKADFQTIAAALEAYKADFGDYPRNANLPTWYTMQGGVPSPAPVYLTLASALMGAGPGISQTTAGGVFEVGDGADGLGFRAQTMNFPVTVSGSSFTASPFTATVSSMPVPMNNFVQGQTVASITLSVGTQYEETVGIASITTPNQLNLGSQPIFPNNHATTDKYLIKIATGKVTPNYLSADTFKIAFVPASIGGGPGTGGVPASIGVGPAGEPVLLDRWGQVIQYFPRYGTVGNRTNDSAVTPLGTVTSVSVGPLFGYSQPKSIDSTNGGNAIWDWRDAAPFFQPVQQPPTDPAWSNPTTGNTDYVGTFTDPTSIPLNNFRPDLAIEWMLGDQNSDNFIGGSATSGSEKLNYDGPYILISAGPDGPERNFGGYCNFADPNNGNQSLPANQLQQTFLNGKVPSSGGGNIYNFDRQ